MLFRMNRQLRRAQEKQDKRLDKERDKKRQERSRRLAELRAVRRRNRESMKQKYESDRKAKERAKDQPVDTKVDPRKLPGRFSGVLTIVTVFFITLQGAAPAAQEQELLSSAITAGFYLMLAYFGTLWFSRRQVPRPMLMAILGGVLVGGSVIVASLIQNREPDYLAAVLAVPGLLVGGYLGRMVFNLAPRR